MNKRVTEVKTGKTYEEHHTETDSEEVFRSLAEDLFLIKVKKSRNARIERDRNNYDGTRTIVINYGNGVRSIYTVEL